MFKKKKTYAILFLIVLAVTGYKYKANQKPKVEYTTSEAVRGDLKRTVSVTGTVDAPVEADLSFKLSGQIETLLVNVGDHVEKGQKIATIDKGTLMTELSKAQNDLRFQKKTLSSMKRKDGYSYYDKDAQQSVIAKYQDAVNEISTNIGDTVLYSPISGTVIKKNVEVGEMTVANAVTENTSVVTIAADGDLQVETDVPESDIVNVKLGQHADITLDALPSSEIISGTVSEIEPASTVIQDVVYYKVKLKFDDPDDRFKVGMSADADINTAEKKDVVMIPMRAVKNEGDQKYVEILNADGQTTERRNVETGMAGDDGMVEAVSGLSGGEKVVTLKK